MIPAPFLFNATVVRVHDGDTISVVVDRGMYDYTGSTDHPIPFRLLGMAARELAEPGGMQARDNLAGLLPAGTLVVLATVKPDKYGPRWLGRLLFNTTGGEQDLATLLILTGWAAAWDGRGAQPKPPWPRG